MKTLSYAFAATLSVSLLVALPQTSADEASQSQEASLLAILRSDAPPADKAINCKKLAIAGSDAAVADLAKLLPDPQLSSWARIALEAIPGPQADEALRTAAQSLRGRLLVGTLNSIGVRRDAKAVESLTQRLSDSDPEVASAAAVALGHIGGADARSALLAALGTTAGSVRSAVAEGCILCAERLHQNAESDNAIAIYDKVLTVDLPQQRVIEATRGAILARGTEGIPRLLQEFRSEDRTRFRLALGIAREFPGAEIDKALVNEIAGAAPARAALIIHAMADRTETVSVPAIVRAAESGPKPVRLAAIDALRRVGNDSCLDSLMAIAIDPDADLATAAQETIAELPGQTINPSIVSMLSQASGQQYVMLLELVGRRRIDAVAEIQGALNSKDPGVRAAALTALGETVSLDQLSVLIDQLGPAQKNSDAPIAEQALKAASVRMADREACATLLGDALEGSSPQVSDTLLEIISEVGGDQALQILSTAANSGNPQSLDTSSRLLGKWNSIDAGPVLLDLAKNSKENKYKVRALRGYLGLARKFADGQDRAQMCQQAIDTAIRLDERKLALQVLALRPSPAGLNVAVRAQQRADLKPFATETILTIAQKIGGPGIDVKQLVESAGLRQVNLEIVSAQYGSGSTQKDVTKAIQKRAGDVALITLPTPSYNQSLGGDPTPGVVKQLRIEYRMNDKPGTAVFAENALILLPMPK